MDFSKDEIKSEFKKRRLRQILASIPTVLAVVLMYYVESLGKRSFYGIPDTTIYSAVLLIIIVVLVFSIINWRCPSCNKYLGKRYNPKFCSRCGVELR